MTMRGWMLIIVLALACTSETTPTKVELPRKSARQSPPPPPPTPTPVESHEIVSGPAQNASQAERRAAVLAILTDGVSASHLSLDADPPEPAAQ